MKNSEIRKLFDVLLAKAVREFNAEKHINLSLGAINDQGNEMEPVEVPTSVVIKDGLIAVTIAELAGAATPVDVLFNAWVATNEEADDEPFTVENALEEWVEATVTANEGEKSPLERVLEDLDIGRLVNILGIKDEVEALANESEDGSVPSKNFNYFS